MSMFSHLDLVPGDAILGLIEAFKQDTNPNKVDLGVGVYRDAHGNTPVLDSVKAAERHLLENETTKTYIGSHGDKAYGDLVLSLAFGEQSPVLAAKRASATQAPGGTGALRLAADLLKQHFPNKQIWLSEPTWPNHIGIFDAAGIAIQRYPYVNRDNQFVFEDLLSSFKKIPHGDVVLLHACCHNPTGYDLTQSQWQQVRDVIKERELLPLVDIAYQGFSQNLDDDAYGVRLLAESLEALIVTTSCSKNFGLYNERIGCLILVGENEDEMVRLRSQAAITARENYSNPPAHGAAIVSTIMQDPALQAQWLDELAEMRERILSLRHSLLDALAQQGVAERFQCIVEQHGMFSYLGLTPEQVETLRKDYGIYMVSSARANMAGLRQEQIEYVAKAFAEVVRS